MKPESMNQYVTLAANIGVLLGILLLAYELNQNREMMQGQTRTELAHKLADLTYQSAADAEIANLMSRGDAGETLTEDERVRYFEFVQVFQRFHENVHYQYRNGLYDEIEFNAQRNAWKNAVYNSEGRVDVWCISQLGFSPEFVAEINGLLTTYKCE
jgi:hypothetical protein